MYLSSVVWFVCGSQAEHVLLVCGGLYLLLATSHSLFRKSVPLQLQHEQREVHFRSTYMY